MFHHSSKSAVSGIIVILIFFETADVYADCGVGFFNNSLDCSKCPENCKYCNSSEFCFSCEVGFSGIICQNKCNSCQNGTRCMKHGGFCLDGCKDGLSGKSCNRSCDSRCLACSRNDASLCVTYKNNLACPAHCLVETRNKTYNSEECLSGYWGDSCEQNCSSGCNRGDCDRVNGTCAEGCKDGFSGHQCDIVCHVRCQSCDRSNAMNCLTWKNNQTCEDICPAECLSKKSTGQHCIDGCGPGYWRERCDQNCSAVCYTGRCDRENGTCTEVSDDSLLCLVLEMSVVVLFALLVVMTTAVICLLRRQRKASDTRRMINDQHFARRPTGEQISAVSSEAYIQHSREHGATSEANEYILLTDTSYSESQYVQLPKADSSSLASDEDRYMNMK